MFCYVFLNFVGAFLKNFNIPIYFVIVSDKNILLQKHMYVTSSMCRIPKYKCSVINCARNRCSANLPHEYVVQFTSVSVSQIILFSFRKNLWKVKLGLENLKLMQFQQSSVFQNQ